MSSARDYDPPIRRRAPRPSPRRLFSFDSQKGVGKSSGLASGPLVEERTHRQLDEGLDGPGLYLTEDVETSDWEQDRLTNATGEALLQSMLSDSDTEKTFSDPFSRSDSDSTTPVRRDEAAGATAVRVPSKVRWDHLRQHVLASSITRPASQASSAQQSLNVQFSSRPQTPKNFRLARLGFRQVVEHVREIAIDDPHKFEEDILAACFSSRSADIPRAPKAERDAVGTIGSSLTLPSFMFNPSLSTSASASTLSLGIHKKHSSIQSLPQTAPSSIRLLHDTISRRNPRHLVHLPHENQILSTLLSPFISSAAMKVVDEDRWTAVEVFELIVEAWPPATHALEVGRCLWCCKAILAPSSVRKRIIAVLQSLLLPLNDTFNVKGPDTFISLIQALISLLPELSNDVSGQAELEAIKSTIFQVESGRCDDISTCFLNTEVDGFLVKDYDAAEVRSTLVTEATVRCFDIGTDSYRRWILHNFLEARWSPIPAGKAYSPLLIQIHSRILMIFNRAAQKILSTQSSNMMVRKRDAQVIKRLFSLRILPDIALINGRHALELQKMTVKTILSLLCVELQDEPAWAANIISDWYNEDGGWRSTFEKTMADILSGSSWSYILRIMSGLIGAFNNRVQKLVVATTIPFLNDRLVQDPPPYPCLPLTKLMDDISQLYPELFYKPLFACAASMKEFAIVNHFSAIIAISRFVSDFWTRNAEMISVAIMKDIGGSDKVDTEAGAIPTWGKARLGQSVLLVELIFQVMSLRNAGDISNPSPSVVAIFKFYAALETRLGILLEAREKKSLIPPSQRILFVVLFAEIRALTGSCKRSTWFSSVISWLFQSRAEEQTVYADDDIHDEAMQSLNKLQAIYIAVQEGFRAVDQHRSTVMLSPRFNGNISASSVLERNHVMVALLAEHAEFVSSLSRDLTEKGLEFLVLISASLEVDDFRRIGPFIWTCCLDSKKSTIMQPACFLAMQCGEKTSSEFAELIRNDLSSDDTAIIIRALQKMNTLVNLRFQLLSQRFNVDRAAHRRVFKLARDPLPFIATDIGSSLFIREDDANDSQNNLPLELRRRLSEIGWADEIKTGDKKSEWMRTPISLLPSHQVDRIDGTAEQPKFHNSPIPSPSSSPGRHHLSTDMSGAALVRRSSNSEGRGVRRRPVFVPSLATLLPQLALLGFHSQFSVASAARDILLDLMRNDPALLARPVFEELASEDFSSAINLLRAFLHIKELLPPAMAHYAFNHLTGYLKFATREEEITEPLHRFAYVASILSKLVAQVSEMSIREIRRAKVEIFLVPSGHLWFPHSAPHGLMFPKALHLPQNSSEVPSSLIWMTMIRLSQNMLFLSILQRNPSEVQVIRKQMTRLVLPSMASATEFTDLALTDFIPFPSHDQQVPLSSDVDARGFSLLLARSYILLISQIFRSMSRHSNDRDELAVLIDGVNRLLLAHGDDIGIVSHAMIALMIASTRFRRMFTSGGGYPLFMPAIIKIHAEAEEHTGIRQAIEYAASRFYALHKETFVFQSLAVAAHIIMLPSCDAARVSRSIYALFFSLRKGIHASSPDAAGIYNLNRKQEQEALMVSTAEEKPQIFLASLRRGGNQDRPTVIIDLPEEYETNRLRMDDFVRLVLTVIAHNPTILRAEQFLRFLLHITPSVYDTSSSARAVLKEGIDALSVILVRTLPKVKAAEGAPRFAGDTTANYIEATYSETSLHAKANSPANIISMCLDCLSLALVFVKCGGRHESLTIQRVFEIVKVLLRENIECSEQVAKFLCEYTSSFMDEGPLGSKDASLFLNNLAPLLSAYASTVDFSDVYATIAEISVKHGYSNEPSFCRAVVSQICKAALDACKDTPPELSYLATDSTMTSLVRLLSEAISYHDEDIIGLIESHTPSYPLLANVIFPLILTMKTPAMISSEGHITDQRRRDEQLSAWLRLLSFTMKSTTASGLARDTSDSPERSDRSQHSSDSRREQMMVTIAAVQIIKAIVIRAERDISASVPSVWFQVVNFFKTITEDGNAHFALNSGDRSGTPSPTPSPSQSARSSINIHNSPDMNQQVSFQTISSSLQPKKVTSASPRFVDYAMWSFFELLCLRRNPLLLHFRAFMQAKTALLDDELRYQQKLPSRRRGHRLSSVSSRHRHRTFSVNSNVSSAAMPVSGSTTRSPPVDSSLHPPDAATRRAGFQQSPTSSPRQTWAPRIVHLGPVRHSSATIFQPRDPRFGEGDANEMCHMTKLATIKSSLLVRATYRRIRLVQTCMGYSSLLPLPGGFHADEDDDDDDVERETWTKSQALKALVQETRELREEFREVWSDEDMVFVSANESMIRTS